MLSAEANSTAGALAYNADDYSGPHLSSVFSYFSHITDTQQMPASDDALRRSHANVVSSLEERHCNGPIRSLPFSVDTDQVRSAGGCARARERVYVQCSRLWE